MEPVYNNLSLEIDPLTKCFSRKSFLPFLEHQLLKAGLNKGIASVAFIDLDGFKAMNDVHGHTFGDEALKYFSSSLRLSLEEDLSSAVMEAKRFIFRYGGDEFVALFIDKSTHEAKKIIQSSLHMIRKRHFIYKGREYPMSFSAGVAAYPADATGAVDLIEKADKALYSSKRYGKGRVTEYSRMKTGAGGFFMAVAAALALAGLVYFAFLNLATLKKFFDISKVAPAAKKPASLTGDLKAIYLKNGGVIKGVITKDADPIEVKVVFEAGGEGTIELKRSEVDRIVSADKSVEKIENIIAPDYQEELSKVSTIKLKSGGLVEGIIVKDTDPMQVRVLLDTGEAVVSIKKSDVESIDGVKEK